MDQKECAAHALCSIDSSRRAQFVVADALNMGMQRELRSVCSQLQALHNIRSGVVTVKRLWDETALRVQMTEASLSMLLGEEFTHHVVAAKNTRNRAPGLVVQSFQQMGSIRWGPDASQFSEIVYPAKIVPATSAHSLWAGLCSSLPALNTDELNRLSKHVRALVLYSYPDGLAANRVCMTFQMMSVPRALCINGHCISHLLMIVWQHGTQKAMATALYQFTQVLTQGGANAKVQVAIASLAQETDIIVGVRPSEEDMRFNEIVLDCTVRRALHVGSYFCDPGGPRYSAIESEAKHQEAKRRSEELQVGLTSPFFKQRVTHNCWGDLPGNRCCVDARAARDRVRSSLRCLGHGVLSSLRILAINKWSSQSRCLSHIGLGMLVHNTLPAGFLRTLASPAEVERIQDLIRNNVAEQQAAADAGQFGDDPQTFRVLRGKRILGAAAFLEDIETPFITLSVCVASIPIDKLFQTIYESESAARSGKHVDPDGRPRVGLLQAMVSGTGILYKTHSRLAAPLFATDSPLTALLPIATERGVSRSRGVRTARAIVLRLSASFDFHFLGTFWHQQYKLLEILADSEADATNRIDRFMHPEREQRCSKCEGLFLGRLRDRLNEPPLLSPAEMASVVREVFSSVADDPLLASAHILEGYHAHARAGMARAMDRRKQLPRRIAACQTLVRWTFLHKSRLGKRLLPIASVRKIS